ncbi:hypothetical protein BT63DRAFT_457828 [Microthyrium microscopicum]|uniref:Uncharacterized protein n=1 Tax=Microthyrium microscopicum TaxID=703497 RepID=A0A6A6U4P4_9PEZI|nr:hypothetical protein BT63DRAFT_457828 [Microthyrium microscopicum]
MAAPGQHAHMDITVNPAAVAAGNEHQYPYAWPGEGCGLRPRGLHIIFKDLGTVLPPASDQMQCASLSLQGDGWLMAYACWSDESIFERAEAGGYLALARHMRRGSSPILVGQTGPGQQVLRKYLLDPHQTANFALILRHDLVDSHYRLYKVLGKYIGSCQRWV